MSKLATAMPRAASASVTAAPIPREPPVTMATGRVGSATAFLLIGYGHPGAVAAAGLGHRYRPRHGRRLPDSSSAIRSASRGANRRAMPSGAAGIGARPPPRGAPGPDSPRRLMGDIPPHR